MEGRVKELLTAFSQSGLVLGYVEFVVFLGNVVVDLGVFTQALGDFEAHLIDEALELLVADGLQDTALEIGFGWDRRKNRQNLDKALLVVGH